MVGRWQELPGGAAGAVRMPTGADALAAREGKTSYWGRGEQVRGELQKGLLPPYRPHQFSIYDGKLAATEKTNR